MSSSSTPHYGETAPSARAHQRVDDAHMFARGTVDPVLEDCVFHVSLECPADVLGSVIAFFQKVKAGKATEVTPLNQKSRAAVAEELKPICSRLLHKLVAEQPADVVDFILQDLAALQAE